MEFSPSNHVVKLCLQGIDLEGAGRPEEAAGFFLRAWNEAADDFEKFIAAYYVARHRPTAADRLEWYETSLRFALQIDDDAVRSAFPALYSNIARCFEELGDPANARKNDELAASFRKNPADKGPFYHGTRADLRTGDLLTPGFRSNYQSEVVMNHIYFTALVNGAGLAAALAGGDRPERVYIVEPTGDFENDPNVTDKKFPGNPTRSYRTAAPLKIVGEAADWKRITPEELKKWREKLAGVKGEIIN
ncbi:MAG: NAD(+)--rifampin ADP-ribosyltransferase [Acidobacteria bacterium]|nr:NAD(+)--rifampin ADP-ribosyltransferase [Acidobacteriota bacterium]